MSDVNPTRRRDEPPARDGAPLAGWPTVIKAEEAVALRGALGQLQAVLDAVVRERDEARAEVERLREVISTLEMVGKAADDERHNMLRAFGAARRQLQAALDTAIRERDQARAEAERMREVLRSYAYPASITANNQSNLMHYDGGARARAALESKP